MNGLRSPRHCKHQLAIPCSLPRLFSTPFGCTDQPESGSFGLRDLVVLRKWMSDWNPWCTGHLLFPQDGTAPLWIASQMGHSEVVRVMLLRGADRDSARNVSTQRPPPTPTCRLVFQPCSLTGKQSSTEQKVCRCDWILPPPSDTISGGAGDGDSLLDLGHVRNMQDL